MGMRKRYKHWLGNEDMISCDIGQLVPVYWTPVLPNDSFEGDVASLIRLSPLETPVMHDVDVRFHSFFVANRLLTNTQEDWENFITGGPDGNDATVLPTVAHSAIPANEPLLDYLGVPPVANLSGLCAFPVRAYNRIIKDFFEDQDLSTTRLVDDMSIFNVAWGKDPYTAARPWPQKGTAVTIPLAGEAPVKGLGTDATDTFPTVNQAVRESLGGTATYARASQTITQDWYLEEDPANPGFNRLVADMAATTGISVNALREALAMQRFQERSAQFGSNYVDYLRMMGVIPADGRLQRAEYIAGGKQRVSFSEVLQSGPDSLDTGVGTLKGHGIAALRTNRFRKFFQEHGIFMTVMSLRPKAIYMHGVPKKFLRKEKEEYFQPEYQFVGQDEILNKEVFADGTSADDDVFGWRNKYESYTHEESRVAGEMRNILNTFHMARTFLTRPALNETFITCNPSKRIFQDQTNHSCWVRVANRIRARRMVVKNPKARIL